eukprot:COSAG06_NODE_10918_length_1596_cov_1.692719_1_plen_241_part_00
MSSNSIPAVHSNALGDVRDLIKAALGCRSRLAWIGSGKCAADWDNYTRDSTVLKLAEALTSRGQSADQLLRRASNNPSEGVFSENVAHNLLQELRKISYRHRNRQEEPVASDFGPCRSACRLIGFARTRAARAARELSAAAAAAAAPRPTAAAAAASPSVSSAPDPQMAPTTEDATAAVDLINRYHRNNKRKAEVLEREVSDLRRQNARLESENARLKGGNRELKRRLDVIGSVYHDQRD